MTRAPIRVLVVALLSCASAARAESPGEMVGLYPFALPRGDKAQAQRIAGWVRQGSAALPGVRDFQLVESGACLPDEGRCLGLVATAAKLDAVVSARVDEHERGYRWHLRRFGPGGALPSEEQGEVVGGPLDLAGALEGGVCKLLRVKDCTGELRVETDAAAVGVHLFVDGRDVGALPLRQPVSLPVGRHAARLGAAEQRVRISQGRAATIFAGQLEGALSLAEQPAPVATAANTTSPAVKSGPTRLYSAAYTTVPIALREPTSDGRSLVGRALVAGGIGLLAAGAGVGLYAQLEGHRLDERYRAGTLTDADKPGYGQAHTAGIAAAALVATGVGALAAGGLVFALTPSSATVGGKF